MVRGLCTKAIKRREHYDRVPATYHKAWFYEKDTPYERWLLDRVVEASITPVLDRDSCKLADVGGGTGRFTDLVRRKLQLAPAAVCVDQSPAMLKEAGDIDGIEAICEDAVHFAQSSSPNHYGMLLLKEVVHHFRQEDLLTLFQGFHRGLTPGSPCVILTRPKTEIDYPFPEAANKVWSEEQPGAEVFAQAMTVAGFEEVAIKVHGYPVEISLNDWTAMIKDRMWSTFSEAHFSSEQLVQGIEEIKTRFPGDEKGMLKFEERIVLIHGYASRGLGTKIT